MRSVIPSKHLKIYFPKIKGKDDSIWYDGLIASYGDALLYAVGDVKIVDAEGECVFDGQPRNDFYEYCPDDIDTDKKLVECIEKNNWHYEENNWFEITCTTKDKKGVFTYGIAYTYSEAIKMLERAVHEMPHLVENSTARKYAHKIESTIKDPQYRIEALVELSRSACKDEKECEKIAQDLGLIRKEKAIWDT